MDSGLSLKRASVPRSVPGVMLLVGEQVVGDRRDKCKGKKERKKKNEKGKANGGGVQNIG